MPEPTSERSLLIVMPVFNDWEPLQKLMDHIDTVLAGMGVRAQILLIDDASSERPVVSALKRKYISLTELHLLSLRRNLGHQRAIAIGLAYINDHIEAEQVIVMDADGQDSPEDFAKLFRKFDECDGHSIVFAERKRRSEGLAFRFFYWLFRVTHQLLTGHAARVGNYSILPREQVRRLSVVSETWNNYAAAVHKSRLPFTTVPTDRATRLAGHTRMNFSSLVSHGLSAMSIYNDVIGVRTLSTAVVLTALNFLAVVLWAVYCFIADVRLDAWLIAGLCLSLATLIVICGVLATFLLLSLAARTNRSFLPSRDYRYYYESAERIQL